MSVGGLFYVREHYLCVAHARLVAVRSLEIQSDQKAFLVQVQGKYLLKIGNKKLALRGQTNRQTASLQANPCFLPLG